MRVSKYSRFEFWLIRNYNDYFAISNWSFGKLPTALIRTKLILVNVEMYAMNSIENRTFAWHMNILSCVWMYMRVQMNSEQKKNTEPAVSWVVGPQLPSQSSKVLSNVRKNGKCCRCAACVCGNMYSSMVCTRKTRRCLGVCWVHPFKFKMKMRYRLNPRYKRNQARSREKDYSKKS